MRHDVEYLYNLTALRGGAALLVAAMHIPMNANIPAQVAGWSDLVRHGYYSVDLFFVLSGFIMQHVYGGVFGAGPFSPMSARRFLLARFARIYPLHLFSLSLLVAAAGAQYLASTYATETSMPFGFFFDLPALATNLLLVQSWGITNYPSWNFPSWSISTEWAAYLLFPFLVPAVIGARWRAGLAVVIAFFVLAIIASGGRGLDVTDFPHAMMRCSSEFLIGMVAYRVYRRGLFQRILQRDAACATVLIALAAVFNFALPDIVVVPVVCLLILSCSFNRSGFARVFQSPPWQALGNMSYSIYMLHIPVLRVLTIAARHMCGMPEELGLIRYSAFVVVFFTVVLAASFLCYRHIEVPSRRWLTQRFAAE